MGNNNQNTVSEIFFVVIAVMLTGGLAVVPAALQEAEAQSGTNSKVCQQPDDYNRHRFNQACLGTLDNPSNPNSACDDGREFGANKTGRANC